MKTMTPETDIARLEQAQTLGLSRAERIWNDKFESLTADDIQFLPGSEDWKFFFESLSGATSEEKREFSMTLRRNLTTLLLKFETRVME